MKPEKWAPAAAVAGCSGLFTCGVLAFAGIACFLFLRVMAPKNPLDPLPADGHRAGRYVAEGAGPTRATIEIKPDGTATLDVPAFNDYKALVGVGHWQVEDLDTVTVHIDSPPGGGEKFYVGLLGGRQVLARVFKTIDQVFYRTP